MPKEEVPLLELRSFIPDGSFEDTVRLIRLYNVHLTVKRQRRTVLGDFRHRHGDKAHRISVNGNLNRYSFLITLLHELAHLFTFERYGNKVMPHGREWKSEFGAILKKYIDKNIFPADIRQALEASLHDPAASSCGNEHLLRILRRYDPQKENVLLAEQLKPGEYFRIKGGRIFKMGNKVRTRYKCQEIATGKWYLFSGLYEVERMSISRA